MECKSRSQRCSDIVFRQVNELVEKNKDNTLLPKYKALCKRSGSLLRTVGLIQFLVFCQAKGMGEKHYAWLLEHLRLELAKSMGLKCSDEKGFLEQIRQQALPQYMRTTREVLWLLQWHKRIATVLIEGNADEGDD